MNLLDNFEFTTCVGTYTATKEGPDGYRISSSMHPQTNYWCTLGIKKALKEGYWKSVAASTPPNGVDANGTPIYFDKTMLNQFDRVITETEGTWIVTSPSGADEVVLNSSCGSLNDLLVGSYGFDAVRIHSAPLIQKRQT